MKLPESEPLSREKQRALKDILHSRPKIRTLEVGYHVRIPHEEADLWALVRQEVPDFIYVGLAGGRQAGKIFMSAERIRRDHVRHLPPESADRIAEVWPTAARGIDGRQVIMIPGMRYYGAMLPANRFFYDLDFIAIPKDPNVISRVHAEEGKTSGTKMDLFIGSQRDILSGPESYFRKVLENSQRIRPPGTGIHLPGRLQNLLHRG